MCPLLYHRDYVCIDYLCFQSKTLSRISYDKWSEQAIYNILLGIGIPEVLMNLISWYGLMKKPNSVVIFNCRYRLVNYYLANSFVVIKHNYNQLSSVPNDVKLGIRDIDNQKIDFVMACTIATSSV